MVVFKKKRRCRAKMLAKIRRVMAIEKQPEDFDQLNRLNWDRFGRVRVAKSGAVPGADTGLGLFATADFQRDDVITEYYGKKIDVDPREHASHQTHDAAIPYSSKLIRGCRRSRQAAKAGQLANDARHATKNNAQREMIGQKMYLVASKPILARQEIFISYGQQYWAMHDAIFPTKTSSAL